MRTDDIEGAAMRVLEIPFGTGFELGIGVELVIVTSELSPESEGMDQFAYHRDSQSVIPV